MARYHINRNQDVRLCHAHARACPYGVEDHFNSMAQARMAVESRHRGQISAQARKTSFHPRGAHNLYAHIAPGTVPKPGEHCDTAHFSERDFDELLGDWERPSRTTVGNYTLDERRAALGYQTGLHKTLNAYMRGEAGSLPPKTIQDIQQRMQLLSRAIQRARLIPPLTLFRGVKNRDELRELKIGDEFREHSFTSTSPSERSAWDFVHEGGYLLQIETPANTPAWDFANGVDGIDEDEIVLLPHRLRVTAIHHELLEGKMLTRIECQYLG